MGDWFFAPEFIALGVFGVLLFYMRGSYSVAIRHTRAFYTTLWVSAACIVSNIIATLFIIYAQHIPLWLNDVAQLVYFSCMPFMPAFIVGYILLQVRDEFQNKKPFSFLYGIFGITLIINIVIVLSTPFTNAMYYFDDQLNYVRGPLNFITMGLSFFYVLYGIVFCVIKRKYISPQLLQVLKWFPLLALVLMGIQSLFLNLQLGGTAAMFCCLVCYLNFQSSKLTTDSLTLCSNRLVFLTTIDYYMRHRQPLTIVAINIRQFKRINEELGTLAGDHLLRYIGDTLRNLPYPGEVFRIGGDKFALLCQASRHISVENVLASLTELFSTSWTVDNVRVTLEADLVSLMCPQVASEPDEILSLLEYAMELPPNTTEENQLPAQVETRVCDMRMRNKMIRREEVVAVLRNALLEDGFQYVYQPIFDIDGKNICAAECLLRLSDPKTGKMIPPGEFIPYAESVGLIPLIGLKVFENVCKFIHTCNEASIEIPPVSVNFSTRQFYNVDLCNHIKTFLTRWQVKPAQIKIEVTESTFIANYFRVENSMSKLTELGIGFYLDDFGTGYASFSRMMSLPFECIKFDQSILSNSQNHRRMHDMLGYLVDGFANLGTRVVVEGVETPDQIAHLKKLHVQEVQGFYYSKPLSETDFYNALLASHLHDGVWQFALGSV